MESTSTFCKWLWTRSDSGAVQHSSVAPESETLLIARKSSVIAIQRMISALCKLWLAVSKEVSHMTFVSSGNKFCTVTSSFRTSTISQKEEILDYFCCSMSLNILTCSFRQSVSTSVWKKLLVTLVSTEVVINADSTSDRKFHVSDANRLSIALWAASVTAKYHYW